MGRFIGDTRHDPGSAPPVGRTGNGQNRCSETFSVAEAGSVHTMTISTSQVPLFSWSFCFCFESLQNIKAWPLDPSSWPLIQWQKWYQMVRVSMGKSLEKPLFPVWERFLDLLQLIGSQVGGDRIPEAHALLGECRYRAARDAGASSALARDGPMDEPTTRYDWCVLVRIVC